jgi:hypothetical protein
MGTSEGMAGGESSRGTLLAGCAQKMGVPGSDYELTSGRGAF